MEDGLATCQLNSQSKGWLGGRGIADILQDCSRPYACDGDSQEGEMRELGNSHREGKWTSQSRGLSVAVEEGVD